MPHELFTVYRLAVLRDGKHQHYTGYINGSKTAATILGHLSGTQPNGKKRFPNITAAEWKSAEVERVLCSSRKSALETFDNLWKTGHELNAHSMQQRSRLENGRAPADRPKRRYTRRARPAEEQPTRSTPRPERSPNDDRIGEIIGRAAAERRTITFLGTPYQIRLVRVEPKTPA
jgi:hypothetical protein